MAQYNGQPAATLPLSEQPPTQYDQQYMRRLISGINQILSGLHNLSVNGITISNPLIPINTVGQGNGTVYVKTLASGEKVLSIVLPGDPQ